MYINQAPHTPPTTLEKKSAGILSVVCRICCCYSKHNYAHRRFSTHKLFINIY